MATGRMDLPSFVGKPLEDGDVDVLRGVRVLAHAQTGAGLHERTPERTAHHNGVSDPHLGDPRRRNPVLQRRRSARLSRSGRGPAGRSSRSCGSRSLGA